MWTIIGLVVMLGGVALVIAIKNADFSQFSPSSIVSGAIDEKLGQAGAGPTLQQIDCARKILGEKRVMELEQSDAPPSQQELDKLKPCFPEGISAGSASRTK